MKKIIWSRRIIQALFLILVAGITYNHTVGGANWLSNASIHAICPFGGVASIYQYFISGTYVKKIHESSFILMWIVFILTVGFGPVFCGWVCPFGSIQEWLGSIGRKIFGKKYNNFIPYKYDRGLRFFRYLVLIWVIYMTVITGKLVFYNIDPYAALFNLWSGEVAVGGLIILVITLIASFLIERPWCKYTCPYGALLGISNFFRIFKIRRNTNTCIKCNRCSEVCPMNIKVAENNVVKDHQCISCLKCSSEEACPVKNTVEFRNGKRWINNVVKANLLGVILLITIFGGIYISSALNIWNTTSTKIPIRYQKGDFKGHYDPSDIRGSYTFKEINNYFNVPVDILGKAFQVEHIEDLNNFQIKNLEKIYADLKEQGKEIGTGSVRLFVGLYTGLPVALDEETYLPESAVEILKEKVNLSAEQLNFLKSHTVNMSNSY